MSQAKSERLMNLVIALLVARSYVSRSRLRQVVAGYGDQAEDAFERMFERDKDELRQLGIPVETGSADPFGDDPGYRIRRSEFELPPIVLEPDEAAVLGLAARVWQHAGLARLTSQALLKLRAAGVEADSSTLAAVEPRVAVEDAAFEPLWQAVQRRQRVVFGYRKPESPVEQRCLQPWAVLSWHGRWYVVGHDVDRDATRLFRLSRIDGTVRTQGRPGAYKVPPDSAVRDSLRSLELPQPRGEARLRVRAGGAFALRRRASAVHPGAEGWDELEVPYLDVGELAEQVVGQGTQVVALAPAELRSEVVERLRALAADAPLAVHR